jgi:hypothetical protein
MSSGVNQPSKKVKGSQNVWKDGQSKDAFDEVNDQATRRYRWGKLQDYTDGRANRFQNQVCVFLAGTVDAMQARKEKQTPKPQHCIAYSHHVPEHMCAHGSMLSCWPVCTQCFIRVFVSIHKV